ncbi:hypothetical protein MPSEU_000110600 [Mayamaea pseudoterrestris]|nr:hypothetical protein MPSEU_000110600 [Mayamaea pseudoterrestris]
MLDTKSLHACASFVTHVPNAKVTARNAKSGDAAAGTWQVYVDQSKLSLDKGGSAALDAFLGLAAASKVQVFPALLPKSAKSRGPTVRCVNQQQAFDVGYVDSVDKVYRILTKHMKVKGVNATVCECLKWKYRGNGYLQEGKIGLAIQAYDKAFACGVASQEGPVCLMRALAFSQRAAGHKEKLKETLKELVKMVPDSSTYEAGFQEAKAQPAIASSLFRRILENNVQQESQYRRTQYRHGLYQYALLAAAQDALRATELLPTYANAWLKAGELLSELWKLQESEQYFERAMELDTSLTTTVVPVIDRLRKRQELLDTARGYGWSDITLRLALDATS